MRGKTKSVPLPAKTKRKQQEQTFNNNRYCTDTNKDNSSTGHNKP